MESYVPVKNKNKMAEIARIQEEIKDEVLSCIREREKMMLELQKTTENIGNKMIEETTMKVLHRIEVIMNTLESILCRCEMVEAKFTNTKNNSRENVHKMQINRLNTDFEKIRQELRSYYAVIERVTGIFTNANQTNNYAIKSINDKISRLSGSKSHFGLHERIKEFGNSFENNSRINLFNPHNQFNNFVTQEFKSIKSAINSTSKSREEADDGIANAMKEFTETLQNGLKIAVNNSKF
ncbi:hypothetical protein FG386_001197 [Cryptosporidium ryanae]|uniref:uncharacterized protein n=1 Tax=Cryptosporidium ryanae TaxID=515981 RepID=UPI00351A8793|nr:hypothetical protein FG386_001197 [Cryptosporidium ryanae]